VAKSKRNPSNSLSIPTQLSRRLRRYSDRSQQLVGKSGILEQYSMPARLQPISTRGIIANSEPYFKAGLRDLQQRISLESACRSLH